MFKLQLIYTLVWLFEKDGQILTIIRYLKTWWTSRLNVPNAESQRRNAARVVKANGIAEGM